MEDGVSDKRKRKLKKRKEKRKRREGGSRIGYYVDVGDCLHVAGTDNEVSRCSKVKEDGRMFCVRVTTKKQEFTAHVLADPDQG
jgi:hypothetical protein